MHTNYACARVAAQSHVCPIPLPTDITVHTNYESPAAAAAAPATIHDKQNMGKLIRYYLRFDDGVVSGTRVGSGSRSARLLVCCRPPCCFCDIGLGFVALLPAPDMGFSVPAAASTVAAADAPPPAPAQRL